MYFGHAVDQAGILGNNNEIYISLSNLYLDKKLTIMW